MDRESYQDDGIGTGLLLFGLLVASMVGAALFGFLPRSGHRAVTRRLRRLVRLLGLVGAGGLVAACSGSCGGGCDIQVLSVDASADDAAPPDPATFPPSMPPSVE